MTDTPSLPPFPELSAHLITLARRAGEEIMAEYDREHRGAPKADGSPVTVADLNANRVLMEGLIDLFPDIYALSEEMAQDRAPSTLAQETFFLIDPLDGTKEFIKKNGEFVVNIALIRHGTPTLGVVYAPAFDELWWGGRAWGAFKEDADGVRSTLRASSPRDSDGLRVTGSRSHATDEAYTQWATGRSIASYTPVGSALKLCHLAEGRYDVYPRFGPTMEWDIGAPQGVLEGAGGQVLTLTGSPLRYAKAEFRNPHFIAVGAEWPSV